ncbi:helix-turn-helix transcriptional regulator [soil metagenome]
MSVRLGLLALLDQADRYGYQLKGDYEASTGGIWPLNIGQVYTTLDRLARDGLVVAAEHDEEERHRFYSITSAGRRVLADWFHEADGDGPPARDELVAKVLLAIPRGRDHALEVVTRQRTARYEALHERRRELLAAEPPVGELAEQEALAMAVVIDALVTRAEADLRWLDLCEERLTSDSRSRERSR